MFIEVMGYDSRTGYTVGNGYYGEGTNLPAYLVSWHMAADFANKVSQPKVSTNAMSAAVAAMKMSPAAQRTRPLRAFTTATAIDFPRCRVGAGSTQRHHRGFLDGWWNHTGDSHGAPMTPTPATPISTLSMAPQSR